MAEAPDPDRLRALEERIAKAKGAKVLSSGSGPTGKGFSQGEAAWRMVLDRVFGTQPIFLILFVLLGFAAGIKTMLGTAAQMGKQAEADAKAQEGKDGRG